MDKKVEELKDCECESLGYCASEETKQKLKARLNRIEGQIRGIINMVERDAYCDDILNQIASARAALAGVSKKVLEGHLKHCVVDGIKEGREDQILEELIVTLNKMMK